MKRYFTCDGEDGLTFHDTAEEAKQKAADDLEWASQGDIDEDIIAGICWGEVKGRAVETERQSREQAEASTEPDDQAAADLMRRMGWDFVVKYRMQDE